MPSAAILNGGRAVRFGGGDKGALLVGGRTIRERQIDILASLADDVLLVGGTVAPPGTRWVADEHPGLGPLAGIEAALRAARHEVVLVIACDMPGVTRAFLAHLLAVADNDVDTVDVVVPRTENGYHPLCAVYRRTCLPLVTANLAAGRLAVQALFPAVRLREVTGAALAANGDPRRLLANVNTPADREALARLVIHED